MIENRGLHIVLLGADDSVFAERPVSEDTLERHLKYGRELGLLRPGSRLTFAVSTRKTSCSRIEQENMVFAPVPCRRQLAVFPAFYSALTKLYRERPIDVVTTQSVFDDAWAALLFGKLHGTPVVGQAHFDFFNSFAVKDALGAGLVGRIRLALGLKAMTRMFAVRVVGSSIADGILSRGLNRNVHFLPVPVALPGAHENAAAGDGAPLRRSVLFVARLVPQKTPLDWLRVAAVVAKKAPDVTFDIVGDGPMRAEMEACAMSLGIGARVKFHGLVPYEDIAGFYGSAGVFLLTSSYEGFGRVLVESYRCGCPAVSTRITGPADIIEDGVSGFLHEPGDIEGMAASALKILGDSALRRRMAAEGLRIVKERFDPARLGREWMALLVEAAGDSLVSGIPPLRATFSRWKSISREKTTLLRSLEYERLRGLTLHGLTLDVGGGKNTSYQQILNLRGPIHCVNIDPAIKPTLIADLNHTLPLASGSYDNVISFNTLEHIYEEKQLVREMLRVLKPGGGMYLVVPFLYKVHASPHDYSRHTAKWWRQTLVEAGADENSLVIEPLVWSPLSSCLSLVDFYTFRGRRIKGMVKRRILLKDVIKQLRWRGMERLPLSQARVYNEYALGFYISGRAEGPPGAEG